MCLLRIKYLSFILATIFLTSSSEHLYSCTIFYLVGDSLILAGNNEDWKDPSPIMWFYPAETGKHGWVKFGWGSGFPQGGINDQGLFWDATAGPYLAMPYSETHKEKYHGPLMQKVIEECASVEEAISIFSSYYCDDLYLAQYLIGDGFNHAVIVEGDSILQMARDHLILTNFYNSNPELGGYPCSRYETASQMIASGEKCTPTLIGTILDATHQEGKYPTQYSQIYDLKSRSFYLFYYHNYEEFIVIDLNKELNKGERFYAIPGLFAEMILLAPETGETTTGLTAEFSWQGKPDFHYELEYATDPGFSEQDTKTIVCLPNQESGTPLPVYGIAGFLFLLMIASGKKNMARSVLIVFLGIVVVACSKEEIPDEEEPVLMSRTVSNLQPGTTYYWKVRAHPMHSDDFWSETVVRIFTTGT